MSSIFVLNQRSKPTLEQLHKLADENTQLIRTINEYGSGGKGNPQQVLALQERLHRNLMFLAEAAKPEHWDSSPQCPQTACEQDSDETVQNSASSGATSGE